MPEVSAIYIYPVKSMRGILLPEAEVTDRGFALDRRWMLVDGDNRFLSQRQLSVLALMQPSLGPEGIQIRFQGDGSSIRIPREPDSAEWGTVRIWDDSCEARYVSAKCDKWFSSRLGLSCRLVCMPEETRRGTDPRYAGQGSLVSFADAYPFLLLSQASLDDLNRRLLHPVPMNRFRPNIVLTGLEPHDEDRIAELAIGQVHFRGTKLCARCQIPGIDQETGVAYPEPNRTLARYRARDHQILFGQNLVHQGLGKIRTGDTATVLTWHEDARFFV